VTNSREHVILFYVYLIMLFHVVLVKS